MNKGLPHLVQPSIVQVLGLESRIIDDGIAWVTFPDAMLLNELHVVHLLLAVLAVVPGRTLCPRLIKPSW